MKTWQLLKHIEEGGRVRTTDYFYQSGGLTQKIQSIGEEVAKGNLTGNILSILNHPECFEIVNEKKKYAYLKSFVGTSGYESLVYYNSPDMGGPHTTRLPERDITINEP